MICFIFPFLGKVGVMYFNLCPVWMDRRTQNHGE